MLKARGLFVKTCYILVSIGFSATVFLTSSKLGLLYLGLGLLINLVIVLLKYRNKILGFSMLLFVVFSTYYIANHTSKTATYQRFEMSIDKFTNMEFKKESTESTEVRYFIWKSSVELLSNNFLFGVGTGDVIDELNEVYAANGYKGALSRSFNPHNQYFQTTIAIGVLGLTSLLVMFIYLFGQGIKHKKVIQIQFILMVSVFALTESILERQEGIVFFTFFAFLFLQSKENENSNQISHKS
ncbi:MAG: O-antigen ligase family protein [Flavobacteriales bacterium]|nr:O-antigen ligase family protein [Flavobacteriales bacterium]